MRKNLLLFSSIVALSGPLLSVTFAQDVDVSDVDISSKTFGDPLDAAARAAGGEESSPAIVTNDAPVTIREVEAKRTVGNETSVESQNSQPMLAPIPEIAQTSYTQTGGLDLNYYNTPIEDVFRQLARYLNRPLNYSFTHQHKVTGTWTNSSAEEILKDIVRKKGLVLKESKISFVVEDHGRNIPIPSGTVRMAEKKPIARSLAVALQEDNITVDIEPVPEKKRGKALERNNRELEAALRKRSELLNQAN